MSQVGWIKIHRQLLESSIWEIDESFDYRSAWVDLMLNVNHEDKRVIVNGRAVTIKRGQKLTSIRKLAKRWHWSNTKVLRFLRCLEEEHMIYKEGTLGGTLLTLVNYSFFQDVRNTSDNASDNASGNEGGNGSDNASGNQTKKLRSIKNDLRSQEDSGQAASAFPEV